MPTVTRIGLVAATLTALAAAGFAAAQSPYPSRPIRVVVPFAPGGGTDIVARLVGQKISESTGQPVVIDNRGGAGGNVGTDLVAKAAADGYTLLFTFASHATNASLYRNLPFDPVNDFAPVTLVVTLPMLVVVHPGAPVKSVRELIDFAKQKPGQVNYASSGSGTPLHLAGELFNRMAGTAMQHVPYKGIAPAMTALLAAEVQVTFPTVLSASQHLKSGRVRALAVTSPRRTTTLPDLPTVAEAALPGFEAVSWYAVYAPARTPGHVLARVHAETVRALRLKDVSDNLVAQGAEPVAGSPAELQRFTLAEIAKWGEVIKAAGIQAE